MKDDARWMTLACEEAGKALGRTAPNPAVGCVITREGEIVGVGHTRPAGGPHAEVVALRDAADRARGATAYVTLEPCCHHGKTGPCTDALVEAGIARVVAGCKDPNPLVAGGGVAELRRRGVEVRTGVRRAAAESIIRGFSHWMTTKTPHVTVKLAASMDGRIAARGGESKWISSEESRRRVHEMRARSDSILVGAGTVLADDPRLTVRDADGADPLRVVLDARLEVRADSRVVKGEGGCLLFTATGATETATKRRTLEAAGAEIIDLPADERGRSMWRTVLGELGRRGHHELLVEGGATVATSALKAGVVNELAVFYNARLIGGDGVPMIGSLGVTSPAEALRPASARWSRCGPDLLWIASFDPGGTEDAASE